MLHNTSDSRTEDFPVLLLRNRCRCIEAGCTRTSRIRHVRCASRTEVERDRNEVGGKDHEGLSIHIFRLSINPSVLFDDGIYRLAEQRLQNFLYK